MASREAAESAPSERKPASHKAGGSKAERMRTALAGYYGLMGLAVSRRDRADGELIAAYAEDFADTWMVAAKANPAIMRVLEAITVAGPYTALVYLHVQVAFIILDRHNANPFAGLFAPVAPAGPVPRPRGNTQREQPAEPAPLPYVPVGPQAPTEATPPPPYQEGDMLVIPDEGIPADLDIQLREAARQSGRPYHELRQEALVMLAQIRMEQNGHSRVQAPGALGAPVARE